MLIVLGVFILGHLAPEILAAFGKVHVPQRMNFASALGFALIAAGVVYG